MDVIPHQQIKPYSHFEEFPLRDFKSLADVFNETSLRIAMKELQKHIDDVRY